MIWCVEDDATIRDIEVYALQSTGFEARGFEDSGSFWNALQHERPQLVVLDVMLPGMDGVELLKKIRASSDFGDLPVIMATAKDAEYDKIQSLDLGADDYIVKPYSLKELAVRIQVILRRSAPQTASNNANILTFGSLKIDKLAHKAFFLEEDLELTNREYEVLMYFAEHPGEEVTFEQLGKCLFGTYQEADRRLVMVNVSRLRKKMSIDPELENMLETVWSKGYRFIVHS